LEGRISQVENDTLVRPFSLEELDMVVKEIKNNTDPGPNGFLVELFRSFWQQLRLLIKEMLMIYTVEGRVEEIVLWVIMPLPKLKPACTIKRFRPICLLNIIYKIITKVLTVRLTKAVGKVINKFETCLLAYDSHGSSA